MDFYVFFLEEDLIIVRTVYFIGIIREQFTDWTGIFRQW